MIRVIIQTEKGSIIVDEGVLWVDIFDGPAGEHLEKRYGYTKDKQTSVPIPNPKTRVSAPTPASERMALDPLDALVDLWLERIRLFWKNILR